MIIAAVPGTLQQCRGHRHCRIRVFSERFRKHSLKYEAARRKNVAPSSLTFTFRSRKWFKSTLVLIPLFGVHQILTLIVSLLQNDEFGGQMEFIWLYVEVVFNTFQVNEAHRFDRSIVMPVKHTIRRAKID